jgi:hypothetical protein
LIDAGHDAVGEIVFSETRRPEDARLIAAAPDLLAALYIALPFVEDHEGDPTYKPGYVSKSVATIRAAIAKAEGVTP